jgi:exosortase K
MMVSVKRNDIFLYALCVLMCAVSYIILNKNIEVSLLPHKTVMEFLFNYNFVFIESVGYEQTNGLFVIAQNCLGAKLFISLFLILVLGFLHKYSGTKRKITALFKFYIISLGAAFVITIVRISASVPFCTWDRFQLIHNIISLTLYFASGLTVYFVTEFCHRKRDVL